MLEVTSLAYMTTQKRLGRSGEGVDVYVIDTGINISHRDFQGRASNFRNAEHTPYMDPPMTMVVSCFTIIDRSERLNVYRTTTLNTEHMYVIYYAFLTETELMYFRSQELLEGNMVAWHRLPI